MRLEAIEEALLTLASPSIRVAVPGVTTSGRGQAQSEM